MRGKAGNGGKKIGKNGAIKGFFLRFMVKTYVKDKKRLVNRLLK